MKYEIYLSKIANYKVSIFINIRTLLSLTRVKNVFQELYINSNDTIFVEKPKMI